MLFLILFRVIISLKFVFLNENQSSINTPALPKNTGAFASAELNQSFCTTEHTSFYFHCIQTDTASINSHTNTHTHTHSHSVSLAVRPASSCGQTWARSPQNSICSLIPYQKHGRSSVFAERDTNKQGHSLSVAPPATSLWLCPQVTDLSLIGELS